MVQVGSWLMTVGSWCFSQIPSCKGGDTSKGWLLSPDLSYPSLQIGEEGRRSNDGAGKKGGKQKKARNSGLRKSRTIDLYSIWQCQSRHTPRVLQHSLSAES